jgi:hypothetical protein
MKYKTTYFPSGKHEGVSIGRAILKSPRYAMYFATKKGMWGEWAQIQAETVRLIDVFDAKPITKTCSGCGGSAVRLTAVASRTSSLYAWCNTCSHHGSGKVVTEIRSYSQALAHNKNNCEGKSAGDGRIILSMASAKGLISPLSEARIAVFFDLELECRRRLKVDPPCRLNIDPGRVAAF